jgi:hypothetical protein
LAIINKKLNGFFNHTVLWTGNGYHIYIVLDTRPLELITDLTKLSTEPSNEFLKFAEIIFTNNRNDSAHTPSFKSCLLRIPYTLNSKCIDNDNKDAEVKVIQRFDATYAPIPQIDANLLRDFRLYLADLDIKAKLEAAKREKVRLKNMKNYHGKNQDSRNLTTIPKQYQWIENKLRYTSIPDHRKITIELVLSPYFAVITHLSFDDTYLVIKDWLMKCNSLTILKPSVDYFDNKVKIAIYRSMSNGIPPIRRENMQRKYPGWYDDFKVWSILD